uniref:Beta-hexosaminidase eukaryotic type N-terminal domain-containing protein n=1 Tax=Trichobilharzia regenti TaxID=157069 RepID=A0AA85JBB2_TRIRE|nr:unnamed protein product [Trichobilharzia regenti]
MFYCTEILRSGGIHHFYFHCYTVTLMERVNAEVKILSTRLKYLSRYVMQQKRQLDSALGKITALEEQLSAHLSKCTPSSPCTQRSIGCQVSPNSKPSVTLSSSRKHSVTLSPDMNDVSSSSSRSSVSKSFNGTIQWLQTASNSVDKDTPKISNKLEINKCQAVNSLSSQRVVTTPKEEMNEIPSTSRIQIILHQSINPVIVLKLLWAILWPNASIDESYQVWIEESQISIESFEVWGALHALETILQLVYQGEYSGVSFIFTYDLISLIYFII